MTALAVALMLCTSNVAAQAPDGASVRDGEWMSILAALIQRIALLERRLAALDSSASQTPRSGTVRRPEAVPLAPSPPSAASTAPADEMARALERALVREGGLVLPAGAIELEPRMRYQHRSTQGLELWSVGGQPSLVQLDRKTDLMQLSLGMRLGLPWSSQLELLLPYSSNRQQLTGSAGVAVTDNASGLGSVELGWTKQLVMHPGGTGLLASIRGSGEGPSAPIGSAIAVGSGFRSMQASLLFVSRIDPVVYFGGLSRSFRQERSIGGTRIDPGDVSAARAGAIIALSPGSSLRLGMELSRAADIARDGATLPGSGMVLGEFSTGFSFVLTPRTLLGVEAGIGLTPSSPNFRLGLSLPIRF